MLILPRWCVACQNSLNYFMTLQSLQNYHRDDIAHVNDNVSNGKSFKHKKKKMVGETLERPQKSGNSGDAKQSNTAISTILK